MLPWGAKRARDGGCSRSMPWRVWRVAVVRSEVSVVGWVARRRESVDRSLLPRLYSKDCWRRKNSRKAGSARRRSSGVSYVVEAEGWRCDFDGEELVLLEDRQIWARRPSIWRRPLRIFEWEREERLSKERVRRCSMLRMPV